MSSTDNHFEYCAIEARVQDDGRDPGRGGHKLMWLQFVATQQSGSRIKIIDRSEKVPLANMIGAASYGPNQRLIAHVNTHANFVAKLKGKGWQLASKHSPEWWQTQLKRPQQQKQSFRERLKLSAW